VINERIRARTVRLLDGDRQIGVLSYHEALTKARTQGLDLVQIAVGDPPVCRILDADHFRFERSKLEREQARRQRAMTVETKEIQLRVATNENDLLIKARRARSFLNEGDKVKITVRFRGRERSHRDYGQQMIARFLVHLGEHRIDKAIAESHDDMTIILASHISKADLLKQRTKPSE